MENSFGYCSVSNNTVKYSEVIPGYPAHSACGYRTTTLLHWHSAFIISTAMVQHWLREVTVGSLPLFPTVPSIFSWNVSLQPLHCPNPTGRTDLICSYARTATHLQQLVTCKNEHKAKNLLGTRQRLYRGSNNIFPALLYFPHIHLSLGLGTLFISYYNWYSAGKMREGEILIQHLQCSWGFVVLRFLFFF